MATRAFGLTPFLFARLHPDGVMSQRESCFCNMSAAYSCRHEETSHQSMDRACTSSNCRGLVSAAHLAHPRRCVLQANVEQLLGALPVHLLAVLVGRQAPGASANASGASAAAAGEPYTAVPAGANDKPAQDGASGLPAVY